MGSSEDNLLLPFQEENRHTINEKVNVKIDINNSVNNIFHHTLNIVSMHPLKLIGSLLYKCHQSILCILSFYLENQVMLQ